MFENESFPVPLDTAAASIFPSKYHHGGRSTFSNFPKPSHRMGDNNLFYPVSHQSSRHMRGFTEEMLGRKGKGIGGRGYYSSGLLPPSFISEREEQEEEGRRDYRRMEETPFPDINDMTFPPPSRHGYRQGNMAHSHYTPLSTSGQMTFSQRMFSQHSSYPRRQHKRRGSFSSVISYNVPPDFEAPTSRGQPLESRRNSLSTPYSYYDEARFSGYMSL